MSCRRHYNEDTRRKPGEDCEDCQRDFETASSYCGICWKIVTNKVYLAKKSPHVTGKCRERHSIPRVQRTVDKKLPYPYPDGFHTPLSDDAFIPYQWLKLDGSPLVEVGPDGAVEIEDDETIETSSRTIDDEIQDFTQEIELLEEQNALLRQLAAM